MSATVWLVAGICLLALIVFGARFYRRWVLPWRHLEHLVDDVINARTPRTFLIDGNFSARRIGIALEDVLFRQRELAGRAERGELNVRAILAAMRDGLAVVDADARVHLTNPALERMFLNSERRTAATVLETFRDSSLAHAVGETLRTGAPRSVSIDLRPKAADGARQIVATSLPMQNDNGEVTGAVVLFHDATQLQQLEQVRREFVSNVSHELRTPLSIFRGYLETLLDEPDLAPDERERILRVLEKHSSRLNSLVDDLLTLARLEAPDPRLVFSDVDVAQFIRRVAKEWEKKAATKDLKIVFELADHLPPIRADEARLEEIVYNLLDNAVKYSRVGGQITIRAEQNEDSAVAISLSDEGSGIASPDLPRIFERFYRADKARSRELGGTGLGLAIVKHIAQLHGGSVEAESQLGRGTTIRVTLPIDRQQTAAVV